MKTYNAFQIIVVLLTLFCAGNLHAHEQYQFTHFTKDNSNLCHNGTRAVLETSNGDIWVGTYMGLSRYDGLKFNNYDRLDLGVDSDYVSCLAEDPSGNVWIGTDAGVVIYDYKTGGFRVPQHNNVVSRIYAIEQDLKGGMWIGAKGYGLYHSDGATIWHVPGTERVANPYRIAVLNEEVIIADYCNDVFVYDGKSLKSLSEGFFFHDDVEGLSLRNVPGGVLLYVASKRHGICEVALSTESVRSVCSVEEGQRPTDVLVNGDVMFVSTTGGVISYNLTDNSSFIIKSDISDMFSLSDDYVRFCYVDGNSSLWIGTDAGGLNYYNKSQTAFTKYYVTSEGLSLEGCRVRGFAQSEDGCVWIATERSGLLSLDKDGVLKSCPLEWKAPRYITAICSYGSSLFLGSVQGVCRVDLQTNDVTYYPPFSRDGAQIDSRVVSIYRTPEGEVFVGGSIGVMRYNSERDTFEAVEELAEITAEDLKYDGDGNIWIASYSQGAFCYNPDSRVITGSFCSQYGNGPVHEMTSSVCIDDNGDPWIIGYSSGFYKYDENAGNFTCINKGMLSSLPSNLFYSAERDSLGRLWLTSDSGLVEFKPKDNSVTVFTVNDGLLSNDFTKSSIVLDDGSMLFGSTDGFIRFKPESFDDPSVPVIMTPPFWRTTGGIVSIVFICSMILAFTISRIAFKIVRARDKKSEKEREAAREAETYREKLNFFSGIIHEIKTPLTLIRTPLQGLMASNLMTEDQMSDLQVISNSTDYLGTLVKELLDFIRVEEHGYVLDKRNVNIIESINFIIFNFADSAKSKNIKLEFVHDVDELVTAVDNNALNKILNNLLDNAIKYGETFVMVSATEKGGAINVAIRNDGPEIPADRKDDIFKPFVRYDANGRDYNQSFGIGLSFARRLAELHGGDIHLISNAQYTEFILELPVEYAPVPAETDETEEAAGCSSSPLLLIVEDNADLSGYIKRKLQSDYMVIRVNSAERAWETLKRYKVDLILTDIGLPGMNGVDFCHKLAISSEFCHIPVIVVSAIASMDVKIKCVENGAVAYIEKPFSLDYLMATIKGALEKRKSIKSSMIDSTLKLDPALPDRDSDFVRKFYKLVSDNLSNPNFSKSDLERELCVSHSTLNRKIKQLLGTTPSEYIRSKRLSVAAQMLSEHKVQISDVLYAVGFTSSSYFAKSFKSKYGKLPMEFMEDLQNARNQDKDIL